MWACLKRLARPRAAIVLFGSQPFTSALVMSNPTWFKYQWVWEKENGTNFFNAPFQPLKVHEDVLVFSDAASSYSTGEMMQYYPQKTKAKPYTTTRQSGVHAFHTPSPDWTTKNSGDRYPRSVLYFNSNQGLHPTQKPLALMEYLVKTYTNEGDRVLDFTSGSGTTLRACKNLGRQCVGIEQDLGYCDATVQRLAPAFEAALIDDGASLEALPMFAYLESELV